MANRYKKDKEVFQKTFQPLQNLVNAQIRNTIRDATLLPEIGLVDYSISNCCLLSLADCVVSQV